MITFHTCCHNLLLEKLSISPPEEEWVKLTPGLLQILSHIPFLFANFAFYPFVILNQNS